VGYCWTRKV